MTTKPAIKSGCYSFKLPLDLEAGEKWKPYPIFSGATATLNDLSCHVSILGHGFSPHPPHSHDEEEVLIVLRGEIDIILKGSHPQEQPCRERLQKNQFVYYPAHFAHTLETTSEEPANYLMLKWLRAPSSEKNLIHFGCFNALPLQGTGKGQQGFSPQVVFEGATRYLKKLQCHTTALDPGASYPPHADSYDVAMFILDGEVRTLGQHIKAPGVIFYKAGTPHGIYNPAECTAKYLVFEFRT
jgi:quercetin dioxygenase-like cupin family protein